MAGHSKWANIKHRKAAQDAKRGKIFTKIIRELVVAAKAGGPNPEDNPRLRAAVDKALGSNMKRDTIDKAVARGAGRDGCATCIWPRATGFRSGLIVGVRWPGEQVVELQRQLGMPTCSPIRIDLHNPTLTQRCCVSLGKVIALRAGGYDPRSARGEAGHGEAAHRPAAGDRRAGCDDHPLAGGARRRQGQPHQCRGAL